MEVDNKLILLYYVIIYFALTLKDSLLSYTGSIKIQNYLKYIKMYFDL